MKAEDEDSFDESFWDLSRMDATDTMRELEKIEGKKGKKPSAKIFKGWG